MTRDVTVLVAARPLYFHGGVPGLKPGDVLLPPAVTGACNTMPEFVTDAEAEEAPWLRRSDLVYCSIELGVAVACAAVYPNGAVYRVRPHQPTPDPDNPRLHVCGPMATVLEVEFPVVWLWEQDYLLERVRWARANDCMNVQDRKILWAMQHAGLGSGMRKSRPVRDGWQTGAACGGQPPPPPPLVLSGP
ncbi:hypothetical protein [Streptomyces sp. NPDC002889]|uniref:hypothetical protein n=1 Tax=Streptomyces sp. NPDC002889 TaxID=3364669 RepID=UPI003695212C